MGVQADVVNSKVQSGDMERPARRTNTLEFQRGLRLALIVSHPLEVREMWPSVSLYGHLVWKVERNILYGGIVKNM